MIINLKGKKALVGGASKGIGKAIAFQLAQAGAQVIILARNEDVLKENLNALKSISNLAHDYFVVDYSNSENLKLVAQNIVEKHGSIDILINNTGGPKAGPANNAELSEFLSAFQQHLIGNHIMMQAVKEGMIKNNFGRIINIISTSVKQPIPGLGVSNTIRGAVANWSKTLSLELAPFGITVNNVLPGATATQRLSEIINNKANKQSVELSHVEEEMKNEIPAARFAQPEEIANAVVFLASDQAAYINGINLPVDGGRTASL